MTVSRIARAFALAALLLLAVSSLSGVPVEPDERKIDPLLTAMDVPAVKAIQRKIAGSPKNGQTLVPIFFRLASDAPAFPDRVRELGGSARKVTSRLYIGRIPPDASRYLSNRPEVSYLEAARDARPLLDVSAPAVHADIVHAGSTGWPPPFNGGIRGGNILVGVVDTGLDGTHPDFSGRIVHEFSFSPSTADPLNDTNGHGSHVTGIVAGDGTGSSGNYSGMAPEASILVGRAGIDSFPLENIFAALNSFLSFAGNAPISINLSLGTATGPHDGTSGFETMINDLATGSAGSQRLIVAAAGNERSGNEHYRVTLPPFGLVRTNLTLEDTTGASVEFWGNREDWYAVTASMGSDSATVDSTFVSASNSAPSGRISISEVKQFPLNGATFILVSFLPQFPGQTAEILLARTRNGGTGKLDGYIDRTDGTFGIPTEISGTITEPANASNVIAVGSFNTKSGGGAGSIGGISSFSSLGPTRDGRTKPDLVAPGSVIYSARSRDAFFRPDLIAPNDNYVILQGTSMAAPHVTGIAALVWESNPNLTGAQMRERLRKTADPPPGAPDNTWGHGKVNALRAVTESVASITAPAAALPGSIVSLTSETSSAAFNNPPDEYHPLDRYSWTLNPPSGSGATLAGTFSPSTSFTPDIPGDYRVDLAVSQSSPPSTPSGNASTVIHVNTLPVASVIGPSFSDNIDPVAFQGVATDPDPGQAKTFRWVLVSRPIGSRAVALASSGPDTAILSPDTTGVYVVGLRVDDGLDNSVLAIKSYTAGPVPTGTGTVVGGSGGGGGCALLSSGSPPSPPSDLAPALLLLPLMILAVGRSVDRRNRPRKR